MELSMRIKENISQDTLGEALKLYASVELLLHQNKTDKALEMLSAIKQGRARLSKEEATLSNIPYNPASKEDSVTLTFSNYTILDDVYWLEANLRLKFGEFDAALRLLQKIREEYPDDILADDANFLQGEIYERHLADKEKAMEIYREFLTQYPGSVYAAEARKRFRTLRGDFNGLDQPQL
jgi:TolA-binding protein